MVFLNELQPYSKSFLVNCIGEESISFLLKESILVKKDESTYSLNFVGLIAFKGILVSVLPKYSTIEEEKEKLDLTVKLIKVFRKYEKSNYRKLTSDFYPLNKGNEFSSILGLSDFFLKDFIYNGYYEREIEEIINDGEDEISWEETISEIVPYFVNKKPYYFTTKNIEYRNDESNIVIAIHQNIIYQNYIKFGKILDYNITNFIVPNLSLDVLGSKTYLINILRREMQFVFNDHKIRLLKAMIVFLSDEFVNHNNDLSIFGTKNFEYIWETILKRVFSDRKNDLRQSVPEEVWKKHTALWENFINSSYGNSDEYKPDIISIAGRNLLILDAKYYNIKSTEKGFSGNPGINDIAKQHIYEIIYGEVFNDHKIMNALLFPSDSINDEYELIGRVQLELLRQPPIILFYINAATVFDFYLNDHAFNEDTLLGFCEIIETNRIKKRIPKV
ncbi:LlaJI family restriction endonuclease [Bacillus paranthracis]|uniref:LlaJI family restriction endonuclease n=1 Tax=Bacillus paranthracis TaxID=2026186 RepID=UPI002549C8E0|nr:LlaJI family restriction endonuclease [Bacillus paranthracis]MDK7491912.1 LlaJI family restriction endonuclease [Bacillus paranthracis]